MMVPAVGNCFCLDKSYRAENSHTRRHLTEFIHAEAEWKNITTLAEHIKKLKKMIKGILNIFVSICPESLLDLKVSSVNLPPRNVESPDESESESETEKSEAWPAMITLRQRVNALLDMEIVEMSHREAIQYCRENGIKAPLPADAPEGAVAQDFGDRDDIPEAQERQMIDWIGKIVMLHSFPKEFKSFYMKSCVDDPSYVQGVDVEVPGVGEIVGSGVRVSDPNELRARLSQAGLYEHDYKEYIDLRRYGPGETSGMGLGVDRFLTWVGGFHSIRQVVTFPRYPGHLTP
jgi:asparaginyl-tRNA synthetase